MNDVKTKQQIVEKIKSSTNILVTVSNDPSVDALSAALGLTLVLNKLGKHATAVFSGAIPPAITFLDPQKTFESTTDSLRDFIIALDKEKADHLRYKVEGDAVKIFITPYRTTITSDDLEFSQGDYNVELVLALGVDNQDHLDAALEAQGRILHDATVVTLSAGDQTSNLGSLDWHDSMASSLSEMLVSLVDGLKPDKSDKDSKDKDVVLLDAETATAFLTGIVAATDRFSNTRTSSKVMTVSAQLMAAGADQQLIAAKLQESHAIGQLGSVEPVSAAVEEPVVEPATKTADGGLNITHEAGETLEDIADKVKERDQAEAATQAEEALAEELKPEVIEVTPELTPALTPAPIVPTVTPLAEVLRPIVAEPTPVIKVADAYALEPQHKDPTPTGPVNWQSTMTEPAFGGVLNATTDQAEEDKRREMEDDQNKTILTHSYLGESPSYNAPVGGASPTHEPEVVDVFASTPSVAPNDELLTAKPELVIPVPIGQTLADIDVTHRAPADELAAVHATFDAAPAPQFPQPSVSLPQPPPLPDFSAMPAPQIADAYALEPAPAAERLGDIFAPDPVAPIQPAPTNNDPAQFKIPGQ
jgi:hypothetical protein